jgi:hypothetical protein
MRINAKKTPYEHIFVKRITGNCDFFLFFSALLYGFSLGYVIIPPHGKQEFGYG